MSKQDTTLLDIYEAAGGTANEDRTMVTVDTPGKPFEITLLVYPIGVENFGVPDSPSSVTFAVLLDDAHTFGLGHSGTQVGRISYDVEITLPVNQVRINRE